VVIYMPMVPQAVIAMLACARLGAVHSVVFGGFAAHELAARIEHATPRAIVCGSAASSPRRTVPYKPMVDKAISISKHKPEKVIVLQRPQLQAELQKGRDLIGTKPSRAPNRPRACPSPPTIRSMSLYTSGTTGRPKGIVRDNGGHAVALKYSMQAIYDAKPGEPYWAASDIGWVVGHSYIVYAPPCSGNTTILYEGKPVGRPTRARSGGWSRNTASARSSRRRRRSGPSGARIPRASSSSSTSRRRRCARCTSPASACDPETLLWAQQKLRIPVVDHWWQTESGWPICANPSDRGLPGQAGLGHQAGPGYDVRILDEAGQEVPRDRAAPSPSSCPATRMLADALWGRRDLPERVLSRYPGYYLTGDGGFSDQDGYLSIMGRIDDVINVAGHRLSTGAMEEVLAAHKDVAECAVVASTTSSRRSPDRIVVLKSGVQRDERELVRELCDLVRERIGPVAFFKQAAIVESCRRRGPARSCGARFSQESRTHRYACRPPRDPAALDEMHACCRVSATRASPKPAARAYLPSCERGNPGGSRQAQFRAVGVRSVPILHTSAGARGAGPASAPCACFARRALLGTGPLPVRALGLRSASRR